MIREELYSNAAFLTLAGPETTSTVMAVVVYMVGIHPDVKANVLKEALATFTSEDEINMHRASTLSYLMAVMEESMRCHPPGPNSLWCITPPEGNRNSWELNPRKRELAPSLTKNNVAKLSI